MDLRVKIAVNGVAREIALEPERSLLNVLREELGITSAKYSCGEGVCGACTVLQNGEPVRSCVVPVAEAAGGSFVTVEGLAAPGTFHPMQRAFMELGAMQCGYCTPGMIVQAAALIARNSNPDEAEIKAQMQGNVCRCCAYPRILRAVRRGAALAKDAEAVSDSERVARASLQSGTGPNTGALSRVEGIPGLQAAMEGPPAELAPHRVPWDRLRPEERDYFELFADGLVVVLPADPSLRGRAVPLGPRLVNGGAWLHVGASGWVTAFTGKVDVGQDNRTAFGLLVAEELRVSPGSVRLVMGDTDVSPFDMGTFGSRSMLEAGESLRRAAAAARERLLAMAAERWRVEAGELVAADGRVRHGNDGRSIAYGELLRGMQRVEVASDEAPLTPASAWQVAGKPASRRAAPDIVTGGRHFPSDLTRPGMWHGKVLRPPGYGATLRAVDVSAARAMPGVIVVQEDGFVGVAAAALGSAQRAIPVIRTEWDLAPQPSERDLVAHLRAHPTERERSESIFHHEIGVVDRALAEAPVKLAQTYTTAYIAHVPLEPRVALAEWEGDRLTVWTSTQTPFRVAVQLAETLGLAEDRVRVVVPPTGDGYGGKHSGEVAVEAARLARACSRPVKVMWTREEEFTWGYFRPAAVIDVGSGAREDGTLTAWTFKNFNAGGAAILCPYEIPNQRIDFQPTASPLRQGAYRALSATANVFARESHLDELAHHLGVDSLALRLRHLRDDRLAAVFQAAAERAGWAGFAARPGHALGIAGGVEKGGRVATCVEVQVATDGRLEILRVVTAFECGAVVNPDNLTNQIEGATVMGLGGALFEAIHFEEGQILNACLSQYRVPRFRDVPPIEAVLLDRKDLPPAGGGETPLVAVAPALANAIFAASGVRLRSLPLAPDGYVR
jgi:isoquinoline 1-oxidoreductase